MINQKPKNTPLHRWLRWSVMLSLGLIVLVMLFAWYALWQKGENDNLRAMLATATTSPTTVQATLQPTDIPVSPTPYVVTETPALSLTYPDFFQDIGHICSASLNTATFTLNEGSQHRIFMCVENNLWLMNNQEEGIFRLSPAWSPNGYLAYSQGNDLSFHTQLVVRGPNGYLISHTEEHNIFNIVWLNENKLRFFVGNPVQFETKVLTIAPLSLVRLASIEERAIVPTNLDGIVTYDSYTNLGSCTRMYANGNSVSSSRTEIVISINGTTHVYVPYGGVYTDISGYCPWISPDGQYVLFYNDSSIGTFRTIEIRRGLQTTPNISLRGDEYSTISWYPLPTSR